jgi:hypothetical protein
MVFEAKVLNASYRIVDSIDLRKARDDLYAIGPSDDGRGSFVLRSNDLRKNCPEVNPGCSSDQSGVLT